MTGKIIYPNDNVFELISEAECNKVREAINAGYQAITLQRENKDGLIERHHLNLSNRINFITTREKNDEE